MKTPTQKALERVNNEVSPHIRDDEVVEKMLKVVKETIEEFVIAMGGCTTCYGKDYVDEEDGISYPNRYCGCKRENV